MHYPDWLTTKTRPSETISEALLSDYHIIEVAGLHPDAPTLVLADTSDCGRMWALLLSRNNLF
jgi:hypothetical protein